MTDDKVRESISKNKILKRKIMKQAEEIERLRLLLSKIEELVHDM
jgi:hypothetical protein